MMSLTSGAYYGKIKWSKVCTHPPTTVPSLIVGALILGSLQPILLLSNI